MSVTWDEVRKDFDREQLRVARELRQMTQAALAKDAGTVLGKKISSAAISQFELGQSVPSASTLAALVEVLRVEPEFVTAAAADVDVAMPAYFRSLRSASAHQRRRARSLVQLVHRLAQVLDDNVGLPERDVPSIPANPYEDEAARRAAAEHAAAQVRKLWRLPRGPIENVVGALEEHGIVCVRLAFDEAKVDAFSVNFSDHPIAVLSTDKDKWDRSRFDAAHELAHIVMHDEAAGVPQAEKQAHEFAAEFLMPRRDIERHLPERADWPRLMELKRTWGVSIAALLKRSNTLGVMSDTAYVSALKVLSARGWRRHEPVDGDAELPSLLAKAISRAGRKRVPGDELRRLAVIPAEDFELICATLSV